MTMDKMTTAKLGKIEKKIGQFLNCKRTYGTERSSIIADFQIASKLVAGLG